jgi:hypothetical protein
MAEDEDKTPMKKLIFISSQAVLAYFEPETEKSNASCLSRFCKGWVNFFDKIQSTVTICAVIAAAGWFLWSDEAAGKADCCQKLNMVEVTSNHTNLWWCSLNLRVENMGERTFDLNTAMIIVQRIKPQSVTSLNFDGQQGQYEWGDDAFDNGGNYYQVDIKVLPKEVDYQNFEFTLPTNIEIFRVYTYINNTNKIINRHYGWDSMCVYEMESNQPVDISAIEKQNADEP